MIFLVLLERPTSRNSSVGRSQNEHFTSEQSHLFHLLQCGRRRSKIQTRRFGIPNRCFSIQGLYSFLNIFLNVYDNAPLMHETFRDISWMPHHIGLVITSNGDVTPGLSLNLFLGWVILRSAWGLSGLDWGL